MARNARVAVIIPAYNHEAYVDEAVRSVLEQQGADLELLIIDDGSTDGTLKRCQAWTQRDARVRVLKQANAGSHATLNRGVAETTAEVVGVLNSDDRWAAGRLQRILDVMRDPGVRFVVTGARLIDADGQAIDDPQHWWNRTQRDFRDHATRHGPVAGLLYGNYTVSTSNFVFRRSLWQEVGAFRPRQMIPDWDWAVRAALTDPNGLRFLADEALLDYRLHGSNAILSRIVRGDLEVARLHRWMLTQMGVPQTAVSALFRAQRDLRRHATAKVQNEVEPWVRQRESEVAVLSAQVQEARARVADREADVSSLQAQLGVLEQHVRDREADIETVTARIRVAEAFLAQREADVAALREQLGIAEAFVRQREEDVQGLREQLTIAENFTRDREQDVQALQKRLESAEAFLHDREQDIQTLRAELVRVEAFLGQRQNDVIALQARLVEVEAFVRAREADVRDLQERLTTAESFLGERERDVGELQGRLAQAEGWVREREADVQVWQAEAASLAVHLRQREADVAGLATRVAVVEGFVRDRETDLEVLRRELATIEGISRERQTTIEHLLRRQAELQLQVDEAESSWIWRQLRRLRRRMGWRRI